MNLFLWRLLSRRGLATALALLALSMGTAVSKGEQIRFSKPAKDIPAPYKTDDNIPETQSKRVDFARPGIAAPIMPQQTIIHIQPRHEDEDDRLSTDGSRRSINPRQGREPSTGQNPFGPRETYPDEFWRGDSGSRRRSEMQRPLSPEMDFDWNARESSTDHQGGSPMNNRPPGERTVDRKGGTPAKRESFGARNELLPSSPFSDIFTSRPKEKPARELLDRRAAFEQMLNPAASIAGRPPGSLEPVPVMEMPRNAPSLVMPSLGTLGLGPKAAEPIQAFNMRERLDNPLLQEMNRKYSAPSGKAPSAAVDSRLQTPLNRQPTSREFPARRF